MTTENSAKAHDDMAEGAEATPRGVRAMGIVRWAFLGMAMVLATYTWWTFARAMRGDAAAFAQGEPKYQCPMHPRIVSAEPGTCPICYMALEPIAKKAGAAHVHADAGPPGTAPVSLALDRVQAIGVRTALVTEGDSAEPLRVTAYVAPPEQGVAEVHARTAGFVEHVMIAQTGVSVRAGQGLVSLYSPEIFQAQSELLAAQKWLAPLGPPLDSGHAALGSSDGGLESAALAGARGKLTLLGMSKAEIQRVLDKREPTRTITLVAPQKGFVTKKNVTLGSYVTPETTLYEIVDLSKVYVVADVFQRDVARVGVGTKGRFATTRRPEAAIAATVDLVYPQLDMSARTTRVRMSVDNAREDGGTLSLSPGEYGTVVLDAPASRALMVPRDAVVDTGRHTYVFVETAPGEFEPRTVTLAGDRGDAIVVTAGVKAGERVVSGATFLIDSESRLRASLAESRQAP